MRAKQAKSSRADHLKPWQFKPGVSGNPSGLAKGTVQLKTRVKNMLLNMSDKEATEFLKGLDKRVIWEMAEGRPQTELVGDLNLVVEVVEYGANTDTT